jgi:hypothetical protein
MAISTEICTSYKSELMRGLHDFGDVGSSPIAGDVINIALIEAGPAGTYGAANTNYSEMSAEEAIDSSSPRGYAPGGGALTNVGVTIDTTTAIADFADITFTAATISSDGCMIYNTTNSNSSIQLHDFGGTKTASGGDFVITFPAAAAATAICRLA